jgi:hypothetical protein
MRESPGSEQTRVVEDQVGSWEWTWELELPAGSPEEMLVALVLRDLVHGSSVDLELVESQKVAELDFTAGDELEGNVYRLVVAVEVRGCEERKLVAGAAEEILDELLAEAEQLHGARQELGSLPLRELEFKGVREEEERWDLVLPDWLAPDDCEVPFGFRSFRKGTGEPWPESAVLDMHGRVVLVPHGEAATLFAVPAPENGDEAVVEGATESSEGEPDALM